MIRWTLTLITLLLTVISTGQEKFDLKLSGQIFNFPKGENEIELIQGNDSLISTIKVDKKGSFKTKIELVNPDYYVLKLPDAQQISLVVTGSEDEIKIYGDGKDLFNHLNYVGSEASTKLLEVSRYNNEYKLKLDSANQYLKANPDKQKEVNEKFTPVYEAFKSYRQGFMNQNPTSPALIGVMSTFNLEQEFPLYEKTVQGLEKGFGESPTVKRVVKEYEENKKKVQASQPLAPGSAAKEIAQPNPDGEIMKLSDYKGKYVLIDFWASWCGPCRKENPNVVELYKKYQDEGFEVFSVSLDKDKARWEAAIKQDNLIWDAHVSDLKFWSSEAARDYNVSSIPFTVLVDPEGKVVNTKLRGVQLEKTLESIYGY